jgi:hypothetical protein
MLGDAAELSVTDSVTHDVSVLFQLSAISRQLLASKDLAELRNRFANN